MPAWHDAERTLVYDGWRTVDRIGEPACTVRIAGASHMSFMDLPFLSVSDDSPARAMLRQTSIDPTRMWRITSDLLLAFFAEHRDGAPGTIGAVIAERRNFGSGRPDPDRSTRRERARATPPVEHQCWTEGGRVFERRAYKCCRWRGFESASRHKGRVLIELRHRCRACVSSRGSRAEFDLRVRDSRGGTCRAITDGRDLDWELCATEEKALRVVTVEAA